MQGGDAFLFSSSTPTAAPDEMLRKLQGAFIAKHEAVLRKLDTDIQKQDDALSSLAEELAGPPPEWQPSDAATAAQTKSDVSTANPPDDRDELDRLHCVLSQPRWKL